MLVDDIKVVARGLDSATKLLFCAQLLEEVDAIQRRVLLGDEGYENHLTLSELVEDFYDRAADLGAVAAD